MSGVVFKMLEVGSAQKLDIIIQIVVQSVNEVISRSDSIYPSRKSAVYMNA